LVTIAKFTNM